MVQIKQSSFLTSTIVFENYSKSLIFEIFLDYQPITIYGLCFSVKIQIKWNETFCLIFKHYEGLTFSHLLWNTIKVSSYPDVVNSYHFSDVVDMLCGNWDFTSKSTRMKKYNLIRTTYWPRLGR